MKYCFVFVCQRGELELKALLLAASLRRHLECEYELAAAVPEPEAQWGRPSAWTREALGRLGVRLVPIVNPFGTDYPIGNKLPALGVETDADKICFLDSDILCLGRFEPHAAFAMPFSAKPADKATYTTDPSVWRRIYAVCGAKFPAVRVCTTVSRELMPPYFNAGVIAVDASHNLHKSWTECATRIRGLTDIPPKPRSLDQIALPVAVAREGIAFDCLDERYNYPAHIKPLPPTSPPYLCHYHFPNVIHREPVLRRLVNELAEKLPGFWEAAGAHEGWSTLRLRSKGTARRKRIGPGSDLVITGIPRSGTSYLCRELHKVRNCVIINEPAEVFARIKAEDPPWGMALLYKELRQKIVDGEPVPNRLDGDLPRTDTYVSGDRSEYRPDIEDEAFVLGTKNTLAYLSHLPRLMRAMPMAGFVACVRNPFDTIASWKASFEHLARADSNQFGLGSMLDPGISERQRDALRHIDQIEALACRRAALWCYLAELVLEQTRNLLVVHYERFAAAPAQILREILAGTGNPVRVDRRWRIAAAQPRSRSQILDREDVDAIHALCAQHAAELGFDLSAPPLR